MAVVAIGRERSGPWVAVACINYLASVVIVEDDEVTPPPHLTDVTHGDSPDAAVEALATALELYAMSHGDEEAMKACAALLERWRADRVSRTH